MTSALEGREGVVEKWTRVLISCVIMYVTRGGWEGVKKFEIFMDVIDGSPLRRIAMYTPCKWDSAAFRVVSPQTWLRGEFCSSDTQGNISGISVVVA